MTRISHWVDPICRGCVDHRELDYKEAFLGSNEMKGFVVKLAYAGLAAFVVGYCSAYGREKGKQHAQNAK